MVLPNFLVAGAAKAGTSTLATMLGQHPQIFMSARKESHHFLHPGRPAAYAGPGDDEMNALVVADWREYEALFDGAGNHRAVGEASVFYMTSTEALERARAALGEVRVIVTLRDPARRAFSAYSHLSMRSREDLGFAEGLAAEPSRLAAGWEPLWGYRSVGHYAYQVERLFDVFGTRNVLLLRFESLMDEPVGELRRAFIFLGVDPDAEVDAGVRRNDTGRPRSRAVQQVLIREGTSVRRVLRTVMPAPLRHRMWKTVRRINLQRVSPEATLLAELKVGFRPDVERLERLTGWDLAGWQ